MSKEKDYVDYLKYKDEIRTYNNKYFGDHLSRQYSKPILDYKEWKKEQKQWKKFGRSK